MAPMRPLNLTFFGSIGVSDEADEAVEAVVGEAGGIECSRLAASTPRRTPAFFAMVSLMRFSTSGRGIQPSGLRWGNR